MRVEKAGTGGGVVSLNAESELDVGALFARHQFEFVRLAMVLVDDRGTAEDVVQEVFASFVRRSASLRDPASAAAYLRKATVNGCRSALRRRRTARLHADEVSPPPVEGPDAEILRVAERRRVMAAVGSLPVRDQQVLALRYWSDLPDQQIAETLGVTVSTVRSTVSRALDKLERTLEAQR